MACGYAQVHRPARRLPRHARARAASISLNGLYDAALDGQPVLAITGMAFHDLIGTHTQQDVALDRLYIGRREVQPADHGPGPRREHDATWPVARRCAYRGVAHHHVSGRSPGDGRRRVSLEAQRQASHLRRVRAERAPARARTSWPARADVLNAGKKVGDPRRSRRAARDRRARAGRRSCSPRRSSKALLGKAGRPGRQPLHDGLDRAPGTKPSQEALEECDTLLMVGTSFPVHRVLPKPGQARGVQIELDPMRDRPALSRSRSGSSATAGRTLAALLPAARGQDRARIPRVARRSG